METCGARHELQDNPISASTHNVICQNLLTIWKLRSPWNSPYAFSCKPVFKISRNRIIRLDTALSYNFSLYIVSICFSSIHFRMYLPNKSLDKVNIKDNRYLLYCILLSSQNLTRGPPLGERPSGDTSIVSTFLNFLYFHCPGVLRNLSWVPYEMKFKLAKRLMLEKH